MTIDEVIVFCETKAENIKLKAEPQTFIYISECLEKLKTIENIMLQYNADWYADEDNGVPDCEVLESIWNVIQDNGLDIDIEQDYRKGREDGYNKAIDDVLVITKEYKNHFIANNLYEEFFDEIEQLKECDENDD